MPASPDRSSARLGRVAGIDYGRARIGVAISDPDRRVASPHENYSRAGGEADARHFRQLAADERIVLFVVGLPVHADGGESEMSAEARQFARWLSDVTSVPVELFDERYSTSEAHELLQQAGVRHKRRKRRLDMLAAQVMLSAYLESRSRGSLPPGPLDA